MDVVQHGAVTIVITSTYDTSDPPTAEVVALRSAATALVPGDADAVDAALNDAIENLEPLPSNRNLCEGSIDDDRGWTTLSGVVEHLRWGLTLQVTDVGVTYCDDLWFATSGGGPSGSGGGPLGPVPPDGVRFTGTGSSGQGDGTWVVMVAGDVPDSAVRVVATMGDRSTDAELADMGPEPGRRWFATAFLSDRMMKTVDVVAYDEAGNSVASGTNG